MFHVSDRNKWALRDFDLCALSPPKFMHDLVLAHLLCVQMALVTGRLLMAPNLPTSAQQGSSQQLTDLGTGVPALLFHPSCALPCRVSIRQAVGKVSSASIATPQQDPMLGCLGCSGSWCLYILCALALAPMQRGSSFAETPKEPGGPPCLPILQAECRGVAPPRRAMPVSSCSGAYPSLQGSRAPMTKCACHECRPHDKVCE